MSLKEVIKKTIVYPDYLRKLNIIKNNSNKIFLLDTPRHGNLGDQAITLAERDFLEKYFCNKKIIEFTYNELGFFLNNIKKVIKKTDIICIQGGGFIGSLWPNEHKMFENILNAFPDNRIFVFPQTAYFSNDNEDLKIRFAEIVSRCKNLTICCREAYSYSSLSSIFGNTDKLLLVPDIVAFLTPNISGERAGVLLCFRNDKEKSISDSEYNRLIENINELKCSFEKTDTVISNFSYKQRRKHVFDKLEQFAHSQLIITDRLHGMLMATITGTPCIAVDNLSNKVSGVYKWLESIDYVICVPATTINKEIIKKYLLMENRHYTNEIFNIYFDQMARAIVGGM